MQFSRSAYEDKIRGLLNKAEGTDNPDEAEKYTEAAERLMIKWGIERAVVRAKMTDEPPEKIVQQRLEYTGTYSNAFVTFAFAIVEGIGQLRCYRIDGPQHKDQRFLYVVGYESDVDRAVTLITSLGLQATTAMKTWWHASGLSRQAKGWRAFKMRRQFIISFGYEVSDRLAATRRETIAETGGTSTELVLRDRAADVTAWFDLHIGELRSGRSMRGSWIGHAEGRAAGRRADIGTEGLSGERTALDG